MRGLTEESLMCLAREKEDLYFYQRMGPKTSMRLWIAEGFWGGFSLVLVCAQLTEAAFGLGFSIMFSVFINVTVLMHFIF